MQRDAPAALLCELEMKLQRPEIRASAAEVAALLADDFFEFGASGSIWSRQQTIEDLPQEQNEPPYETSCRDFAVHWLAEDVALVTYRGTRRVPSEGSERHFLRSSIWKRVEGQWRMAFHQGTPAAAKT